MTTKAICKTICGFCSICDHAYNNWKKYNTMCLEDNPCCCTLISVTCCLPCVVCECLYCFTRSVVCCNDETLWKRSVGVVTGGAYSSRGGDGSSSMMVTNYGECPCTWSGCTQKKPTREEMK